MSAAPVRDGPVPGPPWWIPTAFLTAAVLAQLAGATVLVVVSPELAAGGFYGPRQLAFVHLYGLAMLTLAVLGALAQLVPVIVRQRLASDVVTIASGAALAGGAWVMVAGLWQGLEEGVALGAVLVAIGGLAMAGQLSVVLARAARCRSLGDAGVGIALAVGWLVVVIVLGMLLVVERRTAVIGVDRTSALGAHAAVAVGGWIGGAVVAVGLRLSPMFALAHGHLVWPGRASLALWHPGVALLAIGLLTSGRELVVAGAVLGLGGALCFGAFLLGVGRCRHRAVEAPWRHMVLAALCASSAFGLVLAAALDLVDDVTAGTVAVVAGLVGLGAGATSGHLFKIFPMIVWTGRHASSVGRPGTPRLVDMQPRGLATLEQALFAPGLCALLTGIAVGAGELARAGAWLLLGAAVAVACLSALVLAGWRTRRPAPGQGAPPGRRPDEEAPRAGPRGVWRDA